MSRKLKKLNPRQRVNSRDYNLLIDRVELLSNMRGVGGIKVIMNPLGVVVRGDTTINTNSSEVFRARPVEAAGSTSSITANLYGADGVEILSGELSGITVNCSIIGATALNVAVPRLTNNRDIFICNLPTISGGAKINAFWCTTIFQKSQDCS